MSDDSAARSHVALLAQWRSAIAVQKKKRKLVTCKRHSASSSLSAVCDLCEVRYGKPLKALTVEVTRLYRDVMSLTDY